MARPAIDPQKAYAHLKNKVPWATCDKCGWNWPETTLNFRDGIKVCPNHPDYLESSDQKTVRIEKASARLAKGREPVPRWPHAPEMRGVSGVESITPNPLALRTGFIGSGTLTLTGRELSSADVISASVGTVLTAFAPPVFSPIDPDTRGNTATLTVSARFAPKGDYDLIYNGDVFKNVFQVR